MRAERIVDLRDVGEFRQMLAARPPRIVHGTAIALVVVVAAAIAWAGTTEANLVIRGAARVRPADAPLVGFDEVSNEHVHAEVGGRIESIEVAEGQHVERGAVLMRLETTRIGNEVARLSSLVTAGQAELEAIDRMIASLGAQLDASQKRGDAEIERSMRTVSRARAHRSSDQRLARVELGEAQKELARARDLVEHQAGPAADVAAASARVDRARERLAAARIGVDDGEPEVLRRSLDQAQRDHDVRISELARQRAAKQGELAAAQRQLANLELERGHATLVARRPGIVTLGGLALGDLVAPGKLPLAIVEQGKLRVDAAVGSADVARLRVGMPVRIKLDALDVQRYGSATGAITHIAADSALANGRAYYLISVALDRDEIGRGDLPGRLKAGMTGELEAITDRQPLLALFVRSIRGSISL